MAEHGAPRACAPRPGSWIGASTPALHEGTEPGLLWDPSYTCLVSFPKLPLEETPAITSHGGSSVCRKLKQQQLN